MKMGSVDAVRVAILSFYNVLIGLHCLVITIMGSKCNRRLRLF